MARQYSGLDPMAAGPTRERARAGLALERPTRTRPEARPEYDDNWLGRMEQKRDTMRAGLGDKLGLSGKQMEGIGGGLQGLGQYLMAGGYG
jgi:hypothetical protein